MSNTEKVWALHKEGKKKAQIMRKLNLTSAQVDSAMYTSRKKHGEPMPRSKKVQPETAIIVQPRQDNDEVKEQAWERFKDAYLIKALRSARDEFEAWWGS